MSAPRLEFPARLLGPIVVSSVAALLLPGIDAWAVAILAGGFAIRCILLLVGREPSPSRFWFALSVSAPSAATAWFAFEARAGHAPGPALVSVACAMLGLALASPPTSAALSRIVGLSLAQVAGAAVLVPSTRLSVVSIAYVAVLVPVMVRLATVLSAPRRSESIHVVRRVAALGTSRRSGLPGAIRFLVAALPLGLWFFIALPHGSGVDGGAGGTTTHGPSTGADVPGSATTPGEGAPAESALSQFVSGGKTTLSMGFVSSVQKSEKPVLLVTLDGDAKGPEPLTLRGLAYDVFTGREWKRSSARVRLTAATPDADGWVTVGSSSRPATRRGLTIEDVSGDAKPQLFLAPDPIRVQIDPRGGDLPVAVAPDGTVLALDALAAVGRYREIAEPPPTRELARGRRSDAGVAPDPHDVEAPPDAARYLAIARQVVGDRTDAAERAQRIERWLQSSFTYTRDMPAVRRDRPVLDFLERIHGGHCEYFASSMALLLRSLGHATRIAVGFRGGEFLTSRNQWSFRGNHAHAWCEVFYEGLGFVPYDPTPPLSVRVETTTDGPDAGALDETSIWERVIRFSSEDRRRLAQSIARAAGAVAAVAAGKSALGLWPLLAAVALVLALRMRSRRARRTALGAVDRAGRPIGPFGEALELLEKSGIERRNSEPSGEFLRRVARVCPDGGAHFERLTSLHEATRFGGREPTADDLGRARTALAALKAACGFLRSPRQQPA